MSVGKRLVLLLPALVLLIGAGKRPTPEAPPEVGVKVLRSGGAHVVRVVAPGPISGVELPRQPDGASTLVFLLGEEARALHAVSLEAASDEALRPLLQALPKGRLGALDLDGDGAQELLLVEKDALTTLGPITAPHAPMLLLDTAGSEVMVPSPWADRDLTGIAVAEVGRARFFVPRQGALDLELDVPLPTRAARRPDGIRLSSARVDPVAGESTLLATAPLAVGKQRLSTLLLAAGGASEAWSRLPAPEDVEQSRYATIDGRPSLIVATMNADKLGIFEGKKLRIFALGADRTLAGRAPILATQTSSHRWFPVDTEVADADRDGHDDVIVLQHDGMGGGETVVETFFGRGEGAFVTPGRRQKWEIKSQATHYGADLTGDGIADLAVVDAETLSVFAGTAEPRRSLLARAPIIVPIAVGGLPHEWVRTLRVADLDGDGWSEAILIGGASEERDAILVVSLDRGSTAAPVSAARGR